MIQWLFSQIQKDMQDKCHQTIIMISSQLKEPICDEYNKEPIVPIEESKVLVWTSLGFCIPAYYAYYNEKYSYAYLSFITSGISALYWWRPTYGWRRNLDLCIAKISFITYFTTAYMQMKNNIHPKYPIMVYTGTPLMLLLYNLSCIYPKNWWVYHAGFHIVVNMHKMIIIHFL